MREPTINPYAAPRAEAAPKKAGADLLPMSDGPRLRFGTAVKLAKVCVHCGTRERVKRKAEQFSYVPPVLYLGFPFVAWITAIFVRAATKRATIAIPRCRVCEERVAFKKSLVGPASIAFIVMFFAAATLAGNGLVTAGIVVALVSIAVYLIAYRRWFAQELSVASIVDDVITCAAFIPLPWRHSSPSRRYHDSRARLPHRQ